MVCLYCSSSTQVTNSRAQKNGFHIWRRRKCTVCPAIFTTKERPELGSSLVVEGNGGKLASFERDRLFIAIYEACKHRPQAITDASALTQIIIDELTRNSSEGLLTRGDIITTTAKTLRRFDPTATTVYTAYHAPRL